MEKRTELLRCLLEGGDDVSLLSSKLSEFGWDSEEELVILQRKHIQRILSNYLDNKTSSSFIVEWANAIEGRDDIGFESGYEDILKQIIFELANPEIVKELSTIEANSLLKKLNR